MTTNTCSSGSDSRLRVALFGSFYGGYHVLNELLTGVLSTKIEVVGVATDDPTQSYTHSNVRLWKYPHTGEEEMMVRRHAIAHRLPIWPGRIKGPMFEGVFIDEWAPELCLMATFGQMIPREIFSFPRLGFFNFHHSDSFWPSYPGPDPIGAMLRDGKTHAFLTMHEVTEVLDGGAFVARSGPVPLAGITNGAELHRRSWPRQTAFIRQQVLQILRGDRRPVVSVLPLQVA